MLPEIDIQELRRRAASDFAASTDLALRLLIGRNAPLDPRSAVPLLAAAAQNGHPPALVQMATLSATGFLMPQDWNRALDFLCEAAIRDSAWAQSQLIALSSYESSSHASFQHEPSGFWQRRRYQIDLGFWLSPPERKALCEAPRIRITEGFVSPAVCHWMIEQARDRLQPAKMYDGRGTHFSQARSCSDFIFDITQAGVVLSLIRAKAGALMGVNPIAMESPQIFHYSLGQEMKAHFDFIRSGGMDEPERIATFLLYLNDDYDGGETQFERADLRYRGQPGDAMFFANVDRSGQADRLSLHSALPVRRGEKWIFSQWVQDRPFGTRA